MRNALFSFLSWRNKNAAFLFPSPSTDYERRTLSIDKIMARFTIRRLQRAADGNGHITNDFSSFPCSLFDRNHMRATVRSCIACCICALPFFPPCLPWSESNEYANGVTKSRHYHALTAATLSLCGHRYYAEIKRRRYCVFFLSKHPLRACVRVVTLSVAMISVDRANELSESQLDRGRAQLDLLCDCVWRA